MNLGNLALRAIPGAWILNSGIGKLGMDNGTAGYLKGMAASGIPALGDLSDEQFKKFIVGGEIAVGSALLLPFVPNRLAGLALGGFAAGMLSMYFKNDEMTESDGIRPTQDGVPMAKDMWLAAIALGLVFGRGKKSN
ncbi:hypothetical protein [Falsarthrobacter nasiphocae]|uniref:DoxX family membrane protein n=1 Tax=Falsarthrobacter nasiphocae TaxID=189863 RepID=A0AAE3YHJ5_9MICC|nr:hypothetical protein [Falsarthrobacter nasiphocae]MDR6892309.1 hypothetical protein [Falsarthrobacter nasiphocae]